MKKKAVAPAPNISPERAARLFRLVTLLKRGAQTRAGLIRALRLNLRGFYRDLEVLRTAGIAVALVEGEFVLRTAAARALERLPFPDPCLTVGEARQLARGRSRAHQKLRAQLARIEK
jgi:predicted DNA-binding transcriptional regulator YafY